MIRQRRVRSAVFDSVIQRQLECRALLSTVPAAVGAAGQPALVSADLNGDGKADLVAATDVILPGTKTEVGQLSIQLGNGDGSFGPAEVITLSGPVSAITTGDLNGSGHADIICLGTAPAGSTGGVPGQSVCYVIDVTNPQNDLTIGLPSQFPTAHVAMADINGDGVPDVVGWNDAAVGVEYGVVYKGSWRGAQSEIVQNPFGPGQLQDLGDLNGDGIADAVLNVDGQLEIAGGNGNGSFQPAVALADLPVGSGPTVDGIDAGSFQWGATNRGSAPQSVTADREGSTPSISEITASNTTAGVSVGFTDSNESVSLTITREVDSASTLVITKPTDESSPALYRTMVAPGQNGGLVITFTDGMGGAVSMAVKSQGVPDRPAIAVKTEGDGVKVTLTGANGRTDNVLFEVQATGVSVGLTENGTQVLQFLVQGAGTTAAQVAVNANDGVDTGTCTIDFAKTSTTNYSVPGVQIQEQIGSGAFGMVDVSLGDPAAQFDLAAPPSTTGPIWTSPFAIGDVNGDGMPDLTYLGSQVAEVFLGVPVTSTGTAITPDREGSTPSICEIVAAPPGTVATFVGDVNGDGITDIFGIDAQKNVTIDVRRRGAATVSE